MRVAVGGFYHETNSRAPHYTGLDDFRAYQFAEQDRLISTFAGTNSEIGGMVDQLTESGHAVAPLVFAAAVPSGMIRRECYDHILQRFLSLLDSAGAVDAVMISLHGAASVEGIADADGEFVAAVRRAVGGDARIGVSLDYHANVSRQLFEAADFISIYRTYPHTDMAERGREVVRVTLAGGKPPAGAMYKLPLVTVPLVQATGDDSMAPIMRAFSEALSEQDIASVSLAMGFSYADSPDLGATVLAYSHDVGAAEAVAGKLAATIWAQRERLIPELISLAELPAALTGIQDGPVVLVDPSDNVGGGSAGDGTAILDALVKAGVGGAIVLTDPAAVALARRAGLNGQFSGDVGARADDMHGAPVRLEGVVTWLGDAAFTNSSSYMTGFVTAMGECAVVQAGQLNVVLTSRRTMPFDTGILTAVGIDPEAQSVIVVKSAIAWRAAFGPLAKQVLVVDTPGICPASLHEQFYSRAPRPIWPLDRNAVFGGKPLVSR